MQAPRNRQLVELLHTRVPCALSPNGTHMLSIGMDSKRRVIFLQTPCQQREDSKILQSADMLDALTCSSFVEIIRSGFNQNLTDGKKIREFLLGKPDVEPLLRKTLFEVWIPANKVGLSRFQLKTEVIVNNFHHRFYHSRVIRIVTAWLRRQLNQPWASNLEVARVPSPISSTENVQQFSLGLFFSRHDSFPVKVAEFTESSFTLNFNIIREEFTHKLGILEDGSCPFCKKHPNRPGRHAQSGKHKATFLAAIRLAAHTLETPKIIRILTNIRDGIK